MAVRVDGVSYSTSSESSDRDNIASISSLQVDLGHAESLHNLMYLCLFKSLAVSGNNTYHVSN